MNNSDCYCCAKSSPISNSKVCPECGHVFTGLGWGGIDAHWKAKHEHIMPYEQFWQTMCDAHRETDYPKQLRKDKPHQRVGAISNSHVGRDFERLAQQFWRAKGIVLKTDHALDIGITSGKKPHKFDLGCDEQRTIVECKSHRWTKGDNVPSAKMTTWNEAMFYFHAAPSDYRKVMFVLRDYSSKRKETLAEYYLRTYTHLIPDDVELWEFDENTLSGVCLNR